MEELIDYDGTPIRCPCCGSQNLMVACVNLMQFVKTAMKLLPIGRLEVGRINV